MSTTTAPDLTQPQQKISNQMRAVLAIISTDPLLMDAILPSIDFKNESVDWDQIFSISLCAGHKAACSWAYSIWTDDIRSQANPFEGADSMDANFKASVLKALKLKWCNRI